VKWGGRSARWSDVAGREGGRVKVRVTVRVRGRSLRNVREIEGFGFLTTT